MQREIMTSRKRERTKRCLRRIKRRKHTRKKIKRRRKTEGKPLWTGIPTWSRMWKRK